MTRIIEMNPLERAEREEDLARRDRSEQDASRGFRSDAEVAAGYAAAIAPMVEPIVEEWPCRFRCGATVGMTRSAIDACMAAVQLYERRLIARKEPPIDARTEAMICPTCREREGAERQRPAQRSLEGL